MGNWFSNIHIRNNGKLTQTAVTDALIHILSKKGYRITEDPETASGQITCFLPEESSWITLWGDCLAHDDSDSCAEIASPLSALLHTDVLGIACFDSDYLYLNMINADEQSNGWIGIGAGKDIGITRRNSLSSWKKKVIDYAGFSAKAKQKYIVADSFLQDAAVNLGMCFEQSAFSGEYTDKAPITTLYFVRTLDAESSWKVQLEHYTQYFPCFMDQESIISAVNLGAPGTGLSVYFTGSYAENQEITFSDVKVCCQDTSIAVQLTREKLNDGQWAYAYHAPDFIIPPGAPKRVKKEKRAKMEYERRICVFFTPQGNPRKTLDITVAFVPHENPQGGTQCNIWHQYGSKKAFIEHYNKIWKRVRAIEGDSDQCMPYLKEEDFDE